MFMTVTSVDVGQSMQYDTGGGTLLDIGVDSTYRYVALFPGSLTSLICSNLR